LRETHDIPRCPVFAAVMNTQYTIGMLGDDGVGKFCLIIALVQKNFIDEYRPCTAWVFQPHVVVDDRWCTLDILYREGLEYSSVRDDLVRKSQGFVLTYAITSRTSFDSVYHFREQILRVKDEDRVPMVVVGSKCDLEAERQVAREEGQKMAESFGCPFFETSSKDHVNIEAIFHEIIREIRKDIQEKNNPRPRRSTRSRCSLF
jgi:GTPase KRas